MSSRPSTPRARSRKATRATSPAATTSGPDAARHEGGLIGIEPDGVIGWAWTPAAPERPLMVELRAGGAPVAAVTANVFDDPRIRMLAGAGVPGFIARPSDIAAAPPFLLSLHAPDGTQLGAPLPVRTEAERATLLGQTAPRSVEGNIDGLYDGKLQGWARDPADPDMPLALDLEDGGRKLARADADLLREDLRAAGKGGGCHGFSFDLPAALLDGRPHSLTVRVAGTDTLLPGGPIVFGPSAATALAQQVSDLAHEVGRLRAEIDGLLAPDGAVQARILRILSERLAALADIAQDRTARDLAALRSMVLTLARTDDAPEHYAAAQKPAARSPR